MDFKNRNERLSVGNMNEFTNKRLDQVTDEINNGVVPDINSNREGYVKNEDVLFYNNDVNAVRGLIEETPISNLFFSKENIDALQKGIRYMIYDKYKRVISIQSEQNLIQIMRHVFLENNNKRGELKDVIQSYNQEVLNKSVPEIATNMLQYEGYLDKISKQPIPLDYPEHGRTVNYTYDISNILI